MKMLRYLEITRKMRTIKTWTPLLGFWVQLGGDSHVKTMSKVLYWGVFESIVEKFYSTWMSQIRKISQERSIGLCLGPGRMWHSWWKAQLMYVCGKSVAWYWFGVGGHTSPVGECRKGKGFLSSVHLIILLAVLQRNFQFNENYEEIHYKEGLYCRKLSMLAKF